MSMADPIYLPGKPGDQRPRGFRMNRSGTKATGARA